MADAMIHDYFVKDAMIQVLSHTGQQLKVKLFVNNFVPVRADDATAFTEASFPGYSAFLWPHLPITLDGSSRGVVTPALATFGAPTSGSPVDIYGWFATYVPVPIGVDYLFASFLFTGGPVAFAVGDPDLSFGVALRDFDVHP